MLGQVQVTQGGIVDADLIEEIRRQGMAAPKEGPLR
jgi:hypothetical protein